jgi:hypothetical protein
MVATQERLKYGPSWTDFGTIDYGPLGSHRVDYIPAFDATQFPTKGDSGA